LKTNQDSLFIFKIVFALVKRFIDLLALHKMNHFHWHLTDDQGWRFEVKRYPNLTKVHASLHF